MSNKMKRILYISIFIGLISTISLSARGSGISFYCDPDFTSHICYEYMNGQELQKVPGKYAGQANGPEVTTCSSGDVQISNLFVHTDITGDGEGYVSGLGCVNTSTNAIVFSPDNGTTVENNYATWLLTVASN